VTGLRWRYAWRDLWLNKARTLLVILSIAVGLFAFGIIAGAANTLRVQLPVNYQAVHPAGATLHTAFFDDDEVDAIERMPEVAGAEGRHKAVVRFQLPSGAWHDLELFALDDYTDSQINIIRPWQGTWPPPDREILIERNSLFLTEAEVGDVLHIETAAGDRRDLPVAGLAHDMNQAPAQITGIPYGYVTRDTMEWLGLPRGYNQMQITVAQRPLDKGHIIDVAHAAADKMEESGYAVFWQEVPNPGEHFVMDFLPTILTILTSLGTLALILSGFLVINVITAMLTQQTRQIGVMKAVGADAGQISSLYLRMVMVFGLCALILALPLGFLGSSVFARFIAAQLNFDLTHLRPAPGVLALEIMVGVLVPIVAGLFPILRAARMTVREAVQDRGLGDVSSESVGFMARIQAHMPISRPMRLSLRNTLRRRGRLVRTLIPLMLGGAMFLTVLSVRASLFHTLEETLVSQGFDVQLRLTRPQRVESIERILADIPAIDHAEMWTLSEGIPLHADDSEGDTLLIYALPAETTLLQPDIIAGRWLTPEDTNAIVVSNALLYLEPEIQLGGETTLKINGDETDWHVVGVHEVFQPPIAPSIVYVSQPYFWREHGDYGRANVVRMTTTQHDAATHSAVARTLEDRLAAEGIDLESTRTATEDRSIFTERFNIITVILMIMSFLLATVGSLGLVGTMSINVLERRREIGVMRAIGASTRSVLRIFVAEGILIGVISWMGALVLSQPMSRILSRVVGMTFAKLPLSYIYDWRAPFLWLTIVILVSALASLWPARNAAHITVREALAYE
jgi:putative ABC transport system permease protein